jgi:hypothetical protein
VGGINIAPACRADATVADSNIGDISGGTSNVGQLYFRSVMHLDPYATPSANSFICLGRPATAAG